MSRLNLLTDVYEYSLATSKFFKAFVFQVYLLSTTIPEKQRFIVFATTFRPTIACLHFSMEKGKQNLFDPT